ncbi:M23 family metallopeptidase [Paraferrimonas sp. SM1919]|uniref:M23 family metallopeptidase n=1 Tax=Paraferrimonas sp. SM1919 TaxID=2662263 RepID=UPI0013D67EA6|nr:M23 family metallopeptidase [Paraferrimonas sp. SM1919]
MSVTVLFRTRKGIKQFSIVRPILSLTVFASVIAVATLFIPKQAQHVAEASNNSAQLEQIAQLKQQTQQQLSMLAAKVGVLQAKLARAEAVGKALAEQANISEQFNFDEEIGLGGRSTSGAEVEISTLLQQINDLENKINQTEHYFGLLETVDRNHHIYSQQYLSGRPIVKGWMSSPYGMRNDPFNGRRTMHKGVDFAGKDGSPVVATGAGVVTWANTMFGYGKLVEIDHGNGLKTRYGHSREILVNVGDVVSKGQEVALMGSTGRSTGPHVHYEVLKNGAQIDPKKYVYRRALN